MVLEMHENVGHVCRSSCMSSLSANYIAATFLEFLHLFINLMCAADRYGFLCKTLIFTY